MWRLREIDRPNYFVQRKIDDGDLRRSLYADK